MEGSFAIVAETDAPEVQPSGLYRKEVARVGTWWDGEREIELTEEYLRTAERDSNLFIENGNEVPVPDEHAGADDPSKNKGFGKKFEFDGGRLYAVIEPGKGVKDWGDTVRSVSPRFVNGFKDGAGNEYGTVIQHIARTTQAVIPGQEGFIQLSRQLGVPLYGRKEDSMSLKAIAKKLGLEEGADLATIEKKIDGVIELSRKATEKPEEESVELSRLLEDKAAMEKRAKELEGQVGILQSKVEAEDKRQKDVFLSRVRDHVGKALDPTDAGIKKTLDLIDQKWANDRETAEHLGEMLLSRKQAGDLSVYRQKEAEENDAKKRERVEFQAAFYRNQGFSIELSRDGLSGKAKRGEEVIEL